MSPSKGHDVGDGVDVPDTVSAISDHIEEAYTKETTHDAVFGEVTEDGPNYRNLGWLGTSVLMMKTQIGLGVLSIPSTFDTLGIIPGSICLCVIAAMTTWSDYEIGVFKLNHREVYSIDDAGWLMFGRIGREFLGVAFVLYYIFVAGSGMLGTSIGLNAVSMHGTCTAVFVVVAFLLGFICASIRTLGKVSWLAWVGLFFILSAIFTLTIAVGLQDRPSTAPAEGFWKSDYKLTNTPSFAEAVSAVSALVFAFSGTAGFFSIASEMRDPRLYARSTLICQAIVTSVYLTIGCVVYYYCGSYVASPALGSAGILLKKVCYGLALPGLVVTETIMIHIPAKYVFVRLMRDSRHLTANTVTHWSVWLGCSFTVSLIAYLIASGIPIFNGLVSLIGALLAEAIKQIRAEIFDEKVLENCQYTSTFNKDMIRGMGHARAPFTYDAWKSPEVLAKISQVAEIDLDEDRLLSDADLPAVAWHYDSFPFVCVTMLSDCTGMGTAVVLQGRYIKHQALKALGGRERISMVTCFRPKSPFVKDETVLYTEYRLGILEERIRAKLKSERQRQIAQRPFNIPDVRSFLQEQKEFLESMLEEMIELD
ncbi:amino acid transporter, putative [Paecilomyces variotii No. 5]|uniref:Amino acid transporter, putative n=1 Tax=Byssochlamys spectabilis (strain No. 5 / NBRC 109023) TaxID=1356009 RepID=V5G0E9_BYSSN|nr:amino acid transporter, putative [Paecilomyces variotii No. 5]